MVEALLYVVVIIETFIAKEKSMEKIK
jgi:hypothetical protein